MGQIIMSYMLSAARLSRRINILDGGMGVLLNRLGVPRDKVIWSARSLVDDEHHPRVVEAHAAFIKAGANAIIANSYSVIPGYLRQVKLESELEAEGYRLC